VSDTTAPASDPPALPAAGSTFYTAMRILPRPKREAMYAVYAFCRVVDDIADEEGDKDERRGELGRWRADIDRLYAGETTPRTAALAEPVRRFGLRRADFHAVIDGMAMDLDGPIRAPDWATLDLYCDRVASAVGRLSVRIFGLDDRTGDDLAHHLGRALQLTNILRDIDEDAADGRLYLPREELWAAGIRPEAMEPDAVLSHPALSRACEAVAARAAEHFADADEIMRSAPRAAVKAPRLMGAAYGSILEALVARGWAAPRPRVGFNKLRLLGAVLRYGIV
jgi:phytoene synthase